LVAGFGFQIDLSSKSAVVALNFVYCCSLPHFYRQRPNRDVFEWRQKLRNTRVRLRTSKSATKAEALSEQCGARTLLNLMSAARIAPSARAIKKTLQLTVGAAHRGCVTNSEQVYSTPTMSKNKWPRAAGRCTAAT